VILIPDQKAVLATPTKCGTYSWEIISRKMGWRTIRTQHRMDVPDAFSHYSQRLMTVRNPYSRLVSVYFWLSGPSGWTNWKGKISHTVEWEDWFWMFLEWKDEADLKEINTHRSPHVWTNSLSQNADIFVPRYFVKLEDGVHGLELALGLPKGSLPDLTHSNRNTGRPKRSLEEWYDKAMLKAANKWMQEDCERFGYEVMR